MTSSDIAILSYYNFLTISFFFLSSFLSTNKYISVTRYTQKFLVTRTSSTGKETRLYSCLLFGYKWRMRFVFTYIYTIKIDKHHSSSVYWNFSQFSYIFCLVNRKKKNYINEWKWWRSASSSSPLSSFYCFTVLHIWILERQSNWIDS